MTGRPETDVRLDVAPDSARAIPTAIREETFDIAILGGFSGRPASGQLVPIAVDRDDLDAVLAGFAPAIGLGASGAAERLDVGFGAVDDFHPDALVARVPLFRSIRALASGGAPAAQRDIPPADLAPRAPIREMLEGSVLDHIVAKEQGEDRPDPLAEWIEQVVAPHRVDARDEGEGRLNLDVERLVADGMRALLHDASFQRLEALWRGVEFLVRRVETDARLRIWLVDVTQEALTADRTEASTGGSLLGDLLRGGAGPGGDPWSVVAATWAYGPEPRDLVPLREAARLCSQSGAIFLAGGEPGLAAVLALPDLLDRSASAEPPLLWEAFRREPEARSVGLLVPRLLLRLPYGDDASPCERLDFDETGSDPGFDAYLWGSPVFAALSLLANAFDAAGAEDLWRAVRPEVGDLPLHVRRIGGEAVAAPCTEVALTEHAADRLLAAGLMPLAWLKDSDRVRLVRFQSVASPPSGLEIGRR